MQLLTKGASNFSIKLSPEQVEAFEVYYGEIKIWNPKVNLTAITEYQEVQLKHFLDSLSIYSLPEFRRALELNPKLRIMDVGTGAGFPGVPIKIAFPSIRLALLESNNKKTSFLRHLMRKLGLEGVEILWGRAEHIAHRKEHREQYDVVVARAVAEMPILAEYTLPFCKVGGLVIAYKGPKAPQELEAAREALSILGGKYVRMAPAEVPGLHETRILVVIAKEHPTPEKYPRRPGIPAKRPLGLKAAKLPSQPPESP